VTTTFRLSGYTEASPFSLFRLRLSWQRRLLCNIQAEAVEPRHDDFSLVWLHRSVTIFPLPTSSFMAATSALQHPGGGGGTLSPWEGVASTVENQTAFWNYSARSLLVLYRQTPLGRLSSGTGALNSKFAS
ncbi:hypothetical protein CAPTEDRAFT_210455, partial [Capitella teleta]